MAEEGEAEPEAQPTPSELALNYPQKPQFVVVRFKDQRKVFNTNCWTLNLLDALRTAAGEEKDAAIDLALEETGQMQGINVNARNEEADDGAGGDNVYANTLLTMKAVYVLVRIEAAVDEEGNETGEPSYVAVLDYPEEKDEEGNVIEPEPFNVVAPAP